MNDKINEALDHIGDVHLFESIRPRRRPYWIYAVAAVAALALILSVLPLANSQQEPNLESPGIFQPVGSDPAGPSAPIPDATAGTSTGPNGVIDPQPEPGAIDLSALAALSDLKAGPTFPAMMQYPNREDYGDDWRAYHEAELAWNESQRGFYDQPEGYADSLTDFFRRSINEFLSGEENGAYSPVNVYLAMAMLAETTGGNSRQQILDLFAVSTIEELRTQAGHLWNAHFSDNGQTTLLLANSLWLDDAFPFRQDTVDRLASDYYASVFGGNLGTDESNAQLQAWLNTMTGGLLEEQAKNVKLSKNAVFALASTIYFKAGWTEEFSESRTTDDLFHSPDGDITTAFMHSGQDGTYYRGSNFGAIRLGLTGNNGMWIILPDEGVTVAEVMAGEEYLTMTLDPNAWADKTYCTLNISLPKFDVTKQSDLIAGMKNLGLTDIFDPAISDFSPMTETGRLFVSQINHAARVVIDEEGVIAAAFTVIEADVESAGPSTVIEFNADRPFLFIVSSRDNLPLFAGTVMEP